MNSATSPAAARAVAAVKAREKLRAEEARKVGIRKTQEKNGRTFTFSGVMIEVKRPHYTAQKRKATEAAAAAAAAAGQEPATAAAEAVASPTPLPLAPVAYKRIEYACANTVSECKYKKHRHQFDCMEPRLDFLYRNDGFTYDELVSEKSRANKKSFYSLLLPEMSEEIAPAEKTLGADELSRLPTYVKDLIAIFDAFNKENALAFRMSARDLHLVELNRGKTLNSRDKVAFGARSSAALPEIEATFDASAELVRAQYTEARDINVNEFQNQIEFYTQRCINAGLVKNTARAILPATLRTFYREYIHHRDQTVLLEKILPALRAVLTVTEAT